MEVLERVLLLRLRGRLLVRRLGKGLLVRRLGGGLRGGLVEGLLLRGVGLAGILLSFLEHRLLLDLVIKELLRKGKEGQDTREEGWFEEGRTCWRCC